MVKFSKVDYFFIFACVVVAALVLAFQYGKAQDLRSNSDMLAMQPRYGVVTEDVEYFGTTKGFLAKPDDRAEHPGIVMMHEWWGLNGNIKDMARALASEGYVVLAVDLYDGKVATTPAGAAALVSSVNQTRLLENMKAALAYLRQKQGVRKVGSLGWCFGGGQSLQLAISGEKLDATVLYYGAPLVTDRARLSAIRWPVLGVFGGDDQVIPLSSVQDFNSSLNKLGIKSEVYVYRGVGHAFANPSGMNYAPDETKDSWNKTIAFLDRNLQG
ncbi:MAG: dienelactone hydrolase family protein [Candidatus Micrarchaeia archaeon]